MINPNEIYTVLMEGDVERVKNTVKDLIEKGHEPVAVLNKGLIAAMLIIGDRFKEGEIYLPEVLVAANTMEAGVGILKAYFSGNIEQSLGKVVIGTVEGDVHDIGKNIVRIMLKSSGFDVIDLGIDVTAEVFLQAVKENEPDILAMSALLTTTMVNIEPVIEALKVDGVKGNLKIIVGGAPVTEAFAKNIGADGYAPDAGSAVILAKELLGLG